MSRTGRAIIPDAMAYNGPEIQAVEQQKGHKTDYSVIFDPLPVSEKKLRRLTLPQLTVLHDLAKASPLVGRAIRATEEMTALYLKGWLRPVRGTTDNHQRWRLVITLREEQLHLIDELINQRSRRKVSR
jgi:hypothetical protein